MPTFTEELIEEFDAQVRSDSGVDRGRAEEICEGIERAHRNGSFSVQDVDFEVLFEAWAGDGDLRLGRSRLDAFHPRFSTTRDVQEQALDVMASSAFSGLVNTIIRQGTLDMLEKAPLTVASLVDRSIRLDQNTNKLFGLHDMGDLVQPAEELEETPIFGLAGRTVTAPKAQKEKFALGLTRELLALDTNGLIRAKMREGAEAMALHAEKLIIDMLFALFASGANPWPYIEDDTEYNPYYTSGAGGPWINKISSNGLDGTFAPFQAVLTMKEQWVDDYTGEPVRANLPNVVVCSAQAERDAREGLGPYIIERSVGGDTVITNRPGFGGVQSITLSDYARHRLHEFYQTSAGGSMSTSDALAAASNTWIWGDLQRGCGWGTEWELETLERTAPDTWEYFNQEIVFLVKYMWKVTPLWKNPRVVVLNTP